MMHCPHCGSEVKQGWKFCIKCAKPLPDEGGNIPDLMINPIPPQRKEKKTGGAWVGILIACVAILVIFYMMGAFDGTLGKQLTIEKYNRIQHGMSYDQISRLLEQPGQEQSSSHIPGITGVTGSITTKIYGWQNKDGSNIIVMFQNDRVINKAQFGLR